MTPTEILIWALTFLGGTLIAAVVVLVGYAVKATVASRKDDGDLPG